MCGPHWRRAVWCRCWGLLRWSSGRLGCQSSCFCGSSTSSSSTSNRRRLPPWRAPLRVWARAHNLSRSPVRREGERKKIKNKSGEGKHHLAIAPSSGKPWTDSRHEWFVLTQSGAYFAQSRIYFDTHKYGNKYNRCRYEFKEFSRIYVIRKMMTYRWVVWPKPLQNLWLSSPEETYSRWLLEKQSPCETKQICYIHILGGASERKMGLQSLYFKSPNACATN